MFRRLVIPLVVIVMAVTTTWPLATQLDRSIPQGVESSPTVPVFNLWTVGWNLDRVWAGWRNFWNAPHFHPTEKTLALSEPLIASQALAGFAWLPPPVAYNVFLLLAIALNAGLTWRALRHRRVRWPVALLVSLAMARLPFVHQQLGLLQCVLVAGLIGTIHFGEDACTTGRLSSLGLAAACFDLTFLACGYYGVFLVLLLPAWGGVLIWQCARRIASRPARRAREGSEVLDKSTPRWRVGLVLGSLSTRRRLIVGVVGVLLILAVIVPVVLVQSRVLSDPTYERPRELIQELSARPTDYLATAFPEWFQFVGHSRWHQAGRWKLSPGLLKYALALFGLVVGLRSSTRRGWTLTWLAVSVSAFVGSRGLNFQIVGICPYATLLEWFPTIARLRTPARMSVLVQIAVVFLAAEALHFGFRKARIFARRSESRRLNMRLRTVLAFGMFWLIGIAACYEVSLPRLSFVEVPSIESQKGWIDWLKQNTTEDAVIAQVPFPKGPSPRDYESEAWTMYWGLFHHRRMVNGYSGFFPASYLELKAQMQSFPDEPSFAALRSRGVTFCVCKQSFLNSIRLPEHSESSAPWELVFQDHLAEIAVLRLRR